MGILPPEQDSLGESDEILVVGVDVGELDVDEQQDLRESGVREGGNSRGSSVGNRVGAHLVLGFALPLADVGGDDPLRLLPQPGVGTELKKREKAREEPLRTD